MLAALLPQLKAVGAKVYREVEDSVDPSAALRQILQVNAKAYACICKEQGNLPLSRHFEEAAADCAGHGQLEPGVLQVSRAVSS